MPEAFFHQGNGRGGVLLLHGFTGTPSEIEPLAAPLVAAGFTVLCLRLPGHGVAPPRDEPNDCVAWLADAEAGLLRLVDEGAGQPVALVGLSMGGLLALQLAARHPERVGRVVALAPALQVSTQLSWIFWALGLAYSILPASLFERRMGKGESNITDPEARASNPKSPPFMLRTFLSFDELRLATRAIVGDVHQPILLLHGRLDTTVPLEGSDWFRGAVGSKQVEMRIFERSAHVLPIDRERDEVAAEVARFLSATPG